MSAFNYLLGTGSSSSSSSLSPDCRVAILTQTQTITHPQIIMLINYMGGVLIFIAWRSKFTNDRVIIVSNLI